MSKHHIPEELVTQVNDTFHKGFEIPVEQLQPSALLFQDLQLDSLDMVDLIVHLEEQFDTKLNTERLREIRTLGDIYELVYDVSSQTQAKVSETASAGSA